MGCEVAGGVSPPCWLTLSGGNVNLNSSLNPYLPFPREGIARGLCFLNLPNTFGVVTSSRAKKSQQI
jgi:hypothetical protein